MNPSLFSFVVVALALGIPTVALMIFILRNSRAKAPGATVPTATSVHNDPHSLQTTLMASLLAQQAATAATSADTVATDTTATTSMPASPEPFTMPEISSPSGHIAPDHSCTDFSGHQP